MTARTAYDSLKRRLDAGRHEMTPEEIGFADQILAALKERIAEEENQ